MTDIDTENKEKIKYTVIAGAGLGLLSYIFTKDKTLTLIGGTVGGTYVYFNYNSVKEQIDDITNTDDSTDDQKVDDRQWYEKAIDYTPIGWTGALFREIF
jgi:hypothetical protein